jgi:hypothetical protein
MLAVCVLIVGRVFLAALAQCANPVDSYALRAALANESNDSGHEDEDNIEEDDDAGEQEEEGMLMDTADELPTAHSGEIQPGGPAADPATEAEMVLDALTEQISARQHQLRIEQQEFWSVFGQAAQAIVRAVQKVLLRLLRRRRLLLHATV